VVNWPVTVIPVRLPTASNGTGYQQSMRANPKEPKTTFPADMTEEDIGASVKAAWNNNRKLIDRRPNKDGSETWVYRATDPVTTRELEIWFNSKTHLVFDGFPAR